MSKLRKPSLPAVPTPVGRHPLPEKWQTNPVRIAVVGCGGTGTQMVKNLAVLHVALLGLGHPYGFKVRVYDPDVVTEANIGRQLFSMSDLTRSKAQTTVHRLNGFFGTRWDAVTGEYPVARDDWQADLVITCVDTAKARREIYRHLSNSHNYGRAQYWLDCGNAQETGQVFLTRTGGVSQGMLVHGKQIGDPLPLLSEKLPEIFDENLVEDNRPSCSLAEALESQSIFINPEIALKAARLLEMWFRHGYLSICGYWVNQGADQLDAGLYPVRIEGATK